MRSALYSTITEDDRAIGAMVESAIFAQWFHADWINLHYARWKQGGVPGEVDLVQLGKNFKIEWAVETKWSDKHVNNPNLLKSYIDFCHTNNVENFKITTKSLIDYKIIKNVKITFIPSSLYCYTIGHDLIKHKKL